MEDESFPRTLHGNAAAVKSISKPRYATWPLTHCSLSQWRRGRPQGGDCFLYPPAKILACQKIFLQKYNIWVCRAPILALLGEFRGKSKMLSTHNLCVRKLQLRAPPSNIFNGRRRWRHLLVTNATHATQPVSCFNAETQRSANAWRANEAEIQFNDISHCSPLHASYLPGRSQHLSFNDLDITSSHYRRRVCSFVKQPRAWCGQSGRYGL